MCSLRACYLEHCAATLFSLYTTVCVRALHSSAPFPGNTWPQSQKCQNCTRRKCIIFFLIEARARIVAGCCLQPSSKLAQLSNPRANPTATRGSKISASAICSDQYVLESHAIEIVEYVKCGVTPRGCNTWCCFFWNFVWDVADISPDLKETNHLR